VIANRYVCDRESLGPRLDVFNGLLQLVAAAHSIRVTFVVAAEMVVNDIANKQNLVAIESLVTVQAMVKVSGKFKRAMQIAHN